MKRRDHLEMYLVVALAGAGVWFGQAGEAAAQSPELYADAMSRRQGGLSRVAEPDVLGRAAGPHDHCADKTCLQALPLVPISASAAIHGPFPQVSLKPYFEPDGAYFSAERRLSRGDCAGALSDLDQAERQCGRGCEGINALNLSRARALWCSGQREAALSKIKALDEAGYPGMERVVRGLHRDFARKLGRRAPKEQPPTLWVDADRYVQAVTREAEAQARAGDLAGAIARLRQVRAELPIDSRGRRLAMLEARLHERGGDLEAASAVYMEVWREKPYGQIAQEMTEAIDRLEAAGLKVNPIGLDERLDRLIHLARRGEHKALEKAAAALARRFDLKPGDRMALDALFDGARLEERRERERALAPLDRAIKAASHPAIEARAMYIKGRALRRLDRDAEAIAIYEAIAARHPDDRKAPEALYQAARLRLYQGDVAEARAGMAQLLAKYPDSERLPDGLWQAAWAGWRMGDYEGAAGMLESLSQRYGQAQDQSGEPYELKALYWRARCLGKLDRQQEAIDAYRFVIERHPLTYYAALSWHQIKALGVDPTRAVPFQPDLDEALTTSGLRELSNSPVVAHPRVRQGLELWRTGRRQEAKDALWTQMRFKDAPRGVLELLSTFMLLDGDVHGSYWLAQERGDFSVGPYSGNARLWGLSYPAPDRLMEIATDAAREVGADPMVAFAIIRHESGFRSDVRSGVGATGLMQVMPASARAARKLLFEGKGPGNLRNDRDNIQLGLALVKMNLSYFKGNLPLALGGYNAGSGVAERWWRQFGALDTDELVEQMTYPGTAIYVKKVIGSYYAYRVLHGDGSPPEIALTLPRSLGDWR